MYEEYYGFVQPPFSLTPDPRFLYRSASHDVALQQVWQAIKRNEGFLVLTGDIGTGKTTVCRTLLEQFDTTTFTALILNPFLSVEELLREMLLSYGVVSKEALKSGRLADVPRHELVRALHDFLLSLVPLGGSAVLIIDEAQHLSAEVLEEIRILSNLETDDKKLLQIVIAGQLNLLDMLRKQELRQLDQRISIRCSLTALSREEVEAYITHRLWVGRGSTPVSFAPAAFDLVHALSGGVPRVINLLCDRALMSAADDRTSEVSDAHIVKAAGRIGIEVPQDKLRSELATTRSIPSRRGLAVAAAVAAIALLGAAMALAGNPLELLQPAVLPAAATSPPPATPPGAIAVAVPAQLPSNLAPPPIEGSFSVIVGTFDSARAVEPVAAAIRAQKLPLYMIDVLVGPGDLRRRVLIGRYPTRGEAEAVRQQLPPAMAAARVIPGAWERFRELD
jgi:general secretion pathway protein A